MSAAASFMAAEGIGAVMVVDQGELIGIFTERDALYRVIAKGMDPHATPLREVMTPEPFTIAPHKTYGHALVLMQENGFRHVPVIEDGNPSASCRRAMRWTRSWRSSPPRRSGANSCAIRAEGRADAADSGRRSMQCRGWRQHGSWVRGLVA
ncbi:MAG: CBS domain-containing protein [Ideonella sp.]|nr:CBS domain-containing protein [Ideonella sp.]